MLVVGSQLEFNCSPSSLEQKYAGKGDELLLVEVGVAGLSLGEHAQTVVTHFLLENPRFCLKRFAAQYIKNFRRA